MDDPNWRDQFLSDIIEAQVVLLGHFTATLEAAGLTTREDTADLLRAVADNQDLRQGVQTCLRHFAKMMESGPAAVPESRWQPEVVEGGRMNGSGPATPPGWTPELVEDDEPGPESA